jgi:hypothetical protein
VLHEWHLAPHQGRIMAKNKNSLLDFCHLILFFLHFSQFLPQKKMLLEVSGKKIIKFLHLVFSIYMYEGR